MRTLACPAPGPYLTIPAAAGATVATASDAATAKAARVGRRIVTILLRKRSALWGARRPPGEACAVDERMASKTLDTADRPSLSAPGEATYRYARTSYPYNM